MATSGSVNFVQTRNDIITEALQIAGVVGEGGTPSATQYADSSRTLNMLAKAWMTHGLHLWKSQEIVLFPVKNQSLYSLRETGGDRACLSSELIQTELDGAHSSGATTLTVTGKDGTTNMANADVIGIQTDSGGIHWTTINGAPTSTSIVITSGLSGDAASGNNVYTYTTAFTQRILRAHNAWIHQDGGTDIPIGIISRQEYVDLANKSDAGRVNQLFVDPKLDYTELNVWQVPDDNYTDELIYLRAGTVIENVDSATDDMDFPQEWYLALSWGLAARVGPKYGLHGQELADVRDQAMYELEEVKTWDNETGSMFIQPDNMWNSHRR